MKAKRRKSINFFSFAGIGLIGILSIFAGPAPNPESAVKGFVKIFQSRDAVGMAKIIQPEIAKGKEWGPAQTEDFLKRYTRGLGRLEKMRLSKPMPSEDGTTKRCESHLVWEVNNVAPEFPGPALLEMDLLWALEKDKWWLERPLSIKYKVSSQTRYPTPEQEDMAARFVSALEVLERIGLPGKEDIPLCGRIVRGSAAKHYEELAKLYAQEKGRAGVDPKGRGVQVFLKAAVYENGGFLKEYYGDFRFGRNETRRAMPWDMFVAYASAAIKLGKIEQRRGNMDKAESIYRSVISFARQALSEPGGVQFITWGLRIQRQGALALSKILTLKGEGKRNEAAMLANLATRRLDLTNTCLSCLDEMADYRSLKASILAAQRVNDRTFRPWGINSLVILGLKQAPADGKVIEQAGAMVLVENPNMRRVALKALEGLGAEPTGKVRSFINLQRKWVSSHKVYGTLSATR